MSPVTAITLVVVVICAAVTSAQDFSGSYVGTTANNVLTLNFTFPTPSSFTGNATFQMTDFGSETFPVCSSESFQFTPVNEGGDVASAASSGVPLGVLNFDGMVGPAAATDCMAVQLQWMWITGFSLTCVGATFSSGSCDSFVLTAGAYSMTLNRS